VYWYQCQLLLWWQQLPQYLNKQRAITRMVCQVRILITHMLF